MSDTATNSNQTAAPVVQGVVIIGGVPIIESCAVARSQFDHKAHREYLDWNAAQNVRNGALRPSRRKRWYE